MVGAVLLRRQIINRVAFIFGVGRDDVDTYLWVLGFEFWDVFDFDGKVDPVKVECALMLNWKRGRGGLGLGIGMIEEPTQSNAGLYSEH